MRWYFRWHEPPPLCDCCRPPWWLERLVWRLQRWWHRLWWGRVKVPIPTTIVVPRVEKPFPGLPIDDIVSVQPMTRIDVDGEGGYVDGQGRRYGGVTFSFDSKRKP